MADLLAPQFSFPFRISGTDVSCVEQDTADDYAQNVSVILRYLIGQRSALQRFGIADQALLQGGANIQSLLAAVRRWEPQATIEIVRRVLDDEGIDYVDVNVGGPANA